MDFVKKNAKAVVTFVLGVLLQAVNDALHTGNPPVTVSDWARYLGTSLVAAVVVWATGNKLDAGQIVAGMKKLNTEDQAVVAKKTLNELPEAVGTSVATGYPHWSA